MHAADAFAETLEALLLGENTSRAGTETFEDFLGIGCLEQNDALDLRTERSHSPRDLRPMAGLVIQIVADDRHVDRDAVNGRQKLFRIRSCGNYLKAAII